MDRNVSKTLAEDTVEYGDHTVKLAVILKHTNQYPGRHDILNDAEGYHYYRVVTAEAYPPEGGAPDVHHRSSVALDIEGETGGWLTGGGSTPEVTPVDEHVEHTLRRVLSELDEVYAHVAAHDHLDVDVTVEGPDEGDELADHDDLSTAAGERLAEAADGGEE